MAPARPELIVQTVGPLTVLSPDGDDRTPRSQKAKGLLALLALAPQGRRARAWLQDKLWSTRGQEQGSASLRQVLTELRKAFGDKRRCLKSDRKMVALDLARVEVRHGPPAASEGSPRTDVGILFEDLDIRDNEFEAWLREQRSSFAAEQMRARPSPAMLGPELLSPEAGIGERLQLIIRPRRSDARPRERVVADNLTDVIARTASELSQIDIIDQRGVGQVAASGPPGSAVAVALAADAAEDESGIVCRFTLTSPRDNRLIWSADVRPTGGALDVEDPAVLRNLNQLVERAYRHLHSAVGSKEQRIASLLCWEGIDRFFRLHKEDMLIADRLFEQAYDLEPRGVYLAWRAYLRTFLIVEFIPADRKALAEEALALSFKALEKDPMNSYVAAFGAHVQSIVRQSHVGAFELAERSLQLNPSNPIGWVSLGIAECHLGKSQVGLAHALRARELSGTTPFRFFVNCQASIAGSMAGDVDSAIALAEASHGIAPGFKPPMRFLSALYTLRGRHADSQEMVDRLRVSEPNFSYDLLRDKSYPVSSLQRSGLLTKLPGRQV